MTEKHSPIYRGRCQCGAVSYEADGEPVVVAHCHCSNCQRGSGAGHSTGAMFPLDSLRLVGEVTEYKYISENGNDVTRVFCPKCGSPILGRNSGMMGFATITLGTFEDSSLLRPHVVVFAKNRMPWDIMDNTLPSYEAQPDWKPEKGV